MTDDIPSTDAGKAREGMVDELKTINKYEEMADEAQNPVVADTLKEVADDERVHVGNFGALVAEEDPKAVPKMMEGIEETEKDTGIRVMKRSFQKAGKRQKFWDVNVYDLSGWKKGEDGYWYRPGYPDEVPPAKQGRAAGDGILKMIKEKEKKEKEWEAKVKELDESGYFDGDGPISNLVKPKNLQPIKSLPKGQMKIDDFNKSKGIDALIDANIAFKKAESEGDTEFAKARRDDMWTTDEYGDTIPTQNVGIDPEFDPKEDLQSKYDKTLELIEELKPRINGIIPLMSPQKKDEFVQQLVDAKNVMPFMEKIDRMHPDDLEYIENGFAKLAKGKGLDGGTISMITKLIQMAKGANERDLAMFDRATRSEQALRKQLKDISEESEAKQTGPRDENDPAVLATKADNQTQMNKRTLADIARIIDENGGIDAVADMIKGATRRGEGVPADVSSHEARVALVKELMDTPSAYDWKFEGPVKGDLDQKVAEYSQRVATRANTLRERNRQRSEKKKTKAEQTDEFLSPEEKIAREIPVHHINPNTGEYDENEWYDTNIVDNMYYTPSGMIFNPYNYDISDDNIGDRVTAMRNTKGGEYGRPSKIWLQAIRNALGDGGEALTNETLESARGFPTDTFLSRGGKMDTLGALQKMGIETVGDLRKLINTWGGLYKKTLDPYLGKQIPSNAWTEIFPKETRDAYLDTRADLSDEDKEYVRGNLAGFGGVGPNSNLGRLREKIANLPDDLHLPYNPTHPEMDKTDDARAAYEQWIGNSFNKTNDVAMGHFYSVLGTIDDAFKVVNDLNSTLPARQAAIAKARKAVTDYENNINSSGVPDDSIARNPFGMQLIQYLKGKSESQPTDSKDAGMIRQLLGDWAEAAEDKLVRSIYNMGISAQSKVVEEKARPLLDKYNNMLYAVANVDNFDEYPPLVQRVLKDMARRLGNSSGIDPNTGKPDGLPPGILYTYNVRTKGSPEYNAYLDEKGTHLGKPYINVNYLYSDKFKEYGLPMLEELSKHVDNGHFDKQSYYLGELEDIEAPQKLASDIITNYGVRKQFAEMVSDVDPETAEFLANSDPQELYENYNVLQDVVRKTVMAKPTEMYELMAQREGYAGPQRNFADANAELYLEKGEDYASDKIAGDKEGATGVPKYISEGEGGSGVGFRQLKRETDEAKGITEKPIKGYMNKVVPEDAEDAKINFEDFVERRVDAIKRALRSADRLQGILIRPSGDADDAVIISPEDIFDDPEKFYEDLEKDFWPTYEKLAQYMHNKGAIMPGDDVADIEADDGRALREVIAAVRNNPRMKLDQMAQTSDNFKTMMEPEVGEYKEPEPAKTDQWWLDTPYKEYKKEKAKEEGGPRKLKRISDQVVDKEVVDAERRGYEDFLARQAERKAQVEKERAEMEARLAVPAETEVAEEEVVDTPEEEKEDLEVEEVTKSANTVTSRPSIRFQRSSKEENFDDLAFDPHDRNENFDPSKFKTVKKEVQGSKRTDIDSLIFGRQKQ